MGAICEYCEQDMLAVDSCIYPHIIIDGYMYDRIRKDSEEEDKCWGGIGMDKKSLNKMKDDNRRCHDCNIKSGGLHHASCDMERCPSCGTQMLSCGCSVEEFLE